MISDPRTSPDSRLGRFIFAASVACAAHYMAFFHADATGALHRTDRIGAVRHPHRPIFAGTTVRLDRPALQGASQ